MFGQFSYCQNKGFCSEIKNKDKTVAEVVLKLLLFYAHLGNR